MVGIVLKWGYNDQNAWEEKIGLNRHATAALVNIPKELLIHRPTKRSLAEMGFIFQSTHSKPGKECAINFTIRNSNFAFRLLHIAVPFHFLDIMFLSLSRGERRYRNDTAKLRCYAIFQARDKVHH